MLTPQGNSLNLDSGSLHRIYHPIYGADAWVDPWTGTEFCNGAELKSRF